ncbi:hypothetical protein [Sphaerospermopsis sp. LEGE 08334]|uniref:hypothetical protein n=1 Tax=Sphaerospermopsis sp. LEGE 08334 TaxID=1828651 RepID=UPI001881DD3B|nr:hypothetical protein [Sphaerospermopsis sp. LEGE 08334]MBE9059299.1 hypothetical protein [Sphaerospermopsis sp. LEGE 08334]
MNKATRAMIQISGIDVEVFRLPDGEYVMSQSQVAKAVNTSEFNVRYFLKNRTEESGFQVREKLDTKQVETLSGKDFKFDNSIAIGRDDHGRGGRGEIKIVPIQVATEFWIEQALKHNPIAVPLAYACLEETLKRRCDNAFDIAKTSEQYEQESINSREQWLESRGFLKDAHASFTNCCNYNGFNAAIAHNEITKQLLGKVANELRENELINGDWKIGLNHIADYQDLIRVARVKLQFSRYRSGNVRERIKRAIKDLGQVVN